MSFALLAVGEKSPARLQPPACSYQPLGSGQQKSLLPARRDRGNTWHQRRTLAGGQAASKPPVESHASDDDLAPLGLDLSYLYSTGCQRSGRLCSFSHRLFPIIRFLCHKLTPDSPKRLTSPVNLGEAGQSRNCGPHGVVTRDRNPFGEPALIRRTRKSARKQPVRRLR